MMYILANSGMPVFLSLTGNVAAAISIVPIEAIAYWFCFQHLNIKYLFAKLLLFSLIANIFSSIFGVPFVWNVAYASTNGAVASILILFLFLLTIPLEGGLINALFQWTTSDKNKRPSPKLMRCSAVKVNIISYCVFLFFLFPLILSGGDEFRQYAASAAYRMASYYHQPALILSQAQYYEQHQAFAEDLSLLSFNHVSIDELFNDFNISGAAQIEVIPPHKIGVGFFSGNRDINLFFEHIMDVQDDRVSFTVNFVKKKDKVAGFYPRATGILSIEANGQKVGGFCRINHADPLPDPQTIQIKDDQIICPPNTHTCQIDFSKPDLTPQTLVFINEPDPHRCYRFR